MKNKDERLEEARGKPKGPPRKDPEQRLPCMGCGRIMKRAEFPFMKVGWGRTYRFCSAECVKAADTKTIALGTILGSAGLAIAAVILLLTTPWVALMPHKEPSYEPSMDNMGARDIIFKDVIAHNDGFQTEVGVEIVLTNRGKGSTGPLYIDVFAENETSRVIDSTFNTTTLRYLDNGSTGSIIPPEKSVKINGILLLRPGTHIIYIRIYEDGLKGFIEGQRTLTVTKDQIVLQPWQSTGGSRSADTTAGGAKMNSTPGFEAVWVVVALAAVLVIRKIRSKK